jgi:serine/threonine protein kinase
MEEEIGDGGYSKVYRCTQKNTSEKRACKSIDKSKGQSCVSCARAEVDILLRLQWNARGRGLIVRLHEVFEDERFVHLILELCAGGELYQRQSQIGVFNEMQAKTLIQQMLSAVAHLHRHFVAHRDLKLENWLFTQPEPDLDLRLCDFGLSIVLRPQEKASERVGSVYYVAPEVLAGSYDRRADLWSIGVILFMILSGLPPFNGGKPEEILKEVATGSLSFEASIWKRISGGPRGLIQQLLSRDPAQRPSAEEALGTSWVATGMPAKLKA